MKQFLVEEMTQSVFESVETEKVSSSVLKTVK